MILELSELTSEYVRVKVSSTLAGAAVDPTGDDVEFAFMRGKKEPDEPDWTSGDWETDATGIEPIYYARIILPTLAKGTYAVWTRVHDVPEVVVRKMENALVIT